MDVIDNVIPDTGRTNPQYGECILVGIGIGTGGNEDFPDQTEQIWIENDDVARCGAADVIHIKPEAFHVTARGTSIHEIARGTVEHA